MNNDLEKMRALAQVIETNDLKCYSAKTLSSYFTSIEDSYRHDQVIRCVGQVLEKKAFDNPNGIVTGEELSKLANQFAGLGSVENFKKVCADLLPVALTEDNTQEQHIESTRHNYFEDGSRIPSKEAQLEIDEFDLAKTEVPNVLANIFDKQDMKLAHVAVSEELTNRGEYLVADELKGLGLDSIVVYTVCNNDTLLYTASIDTEIGKQVVYVPVEMVNGQVLYPTSFAIANRIFELSKEGVQQFLNIRRAEHETKQNTVATAARDTFLTDVAREVKSNDGSIEVDEHTLAESDFAGSEVKMPEALIPVAEILENSIIRKESKYKDNEINLVIGMVRDELTKLGYANTTIKFEGDNKKGLNISAAVQTPEGKFDIVVPVEVSNGQVLYPTAFAGVRDMDLMKKIDTEKAKDKSEEKDDEEEVEITSSSYDLTKEGFQKFITANLENAIPVRYSSDLIDLQFNDLRKIMYKAVADKRYTVAEQALSVIADKYGTEHHAAAMEDYRGLLTGASLDYKDNFGSTMRSTNFEDTRDSWTGEMVTSQIKLT